MTSVLRCCIVVFSVLCYSVVLTAQITITKSDVDANFINQKWISVSDTTTDTLDLGSASSSPQSWDVSSIVFAPETARFDTADYQSAAGHLRASDFPSAAACVTTSIDSTILVYTLTETFVEYYGTQVDGAYDLGYVLHMHVSPTPPPPLPADTMMEYFHHPGQLEFPLPLTLGTIRSVTDTITDGSGTKIVEASFSADGYGTVKFPSGQSMSAIRVVHDEVVTKVDNGVPTQEPKERHIEFYAQDLSQIAIGVDTNYSGGRTPAVDYRYGRRAVALGVLERKNALPGMFSLAQNYPNPFNPSTTISFQLPERSFVVLKVFDMLGREVATVVRQSLDAGFHEVEWNASREPSGVYYYRIDAGKNSAVKKLLLMK